MKFVLLLTTLFAMDPSQWEGAQDPFEPFEGDIEEQDFEPLETIEPLQGNYVKGMYFAGNAIGTTPVERMMLAAADGPATFDCTKCIKDVACMTFCSTHVIRAQILSLRKQTAFLTILCNYKGNPSLARNVTITNKSQSSYVESSDSLEYQDDSEQEMDYDDNGYQVEDTYRFQKRAQKTFSIKIPKKCKSSIKKDGILVFFVKKMREKLVLYTKSCDAIQNDTLSIQTDVVKNSKKDLQGSKCIVADLVSTKALKSSSISMSFSLVFLLTLL